MSGIYGVVSRKDVDSSNYKGLDVWNDNYGDLTAQRFADKNAYLGIKPEYLKDESDEKKVFSDNGMVGVFDALIYSEKNSKDTDEKFLFNAVKEHGVNGVKEINGDFSGAVYEAASKKLILFRDHLGVRPLFYYMDEDRVIFSTDIRGILSVRDVDAAVNEEWLVARLAGDAFMTPARTEYEHIRCVPFGGSITFEFGESGIKKSEELYYVPGKKKIRLKNREEYTKELRRLVEDAVKIRAEATSQKIGAELSGGLDSGVIDLLLARMNKECLYFSWTPGEDELKLAENDERLIIKDICDKAGIKCEFRGLTISFGEESLMHQRFPLGEGEYKDSNFAIAYACPVYANTTPIFATASYMRKNGVKFVFTGHGGDEGVSHRSNPYELWYYHEYYRYLRLMYSRSSLDKHRIKKTLELIRENQNYAKTKLMAPFKAEIFASKIASKEFEKKYENRKRKALSFFYDPIAYVRGGGSRNRLDVLAYYSSCTGVRYMVPFLDYRALDFALGIPRYLYHNWYFNRYIFKEAFKDLMPESLYNYRIKEENSFKGLDKKEKTAEDDRCSEELIEIRKDVVALLDYEYWKKYLDYELIDSWIKGENDPSSDSVIYSGIMTCAQVEHLVKRSREANDI